MADYKAPLRDIRFALMEVLQYDKHCSAVQGCDSASVDIVDAILEENAKFCEQVLAPLNAVGDQQGCQLSESGEVSTPSGFKEAYQQYVGAGWSSMTHPESDGGQGLPKSLATVLSEMMGAANWSWTMYPGLSHGAISTIDRHGDAAQKARYLSRLISGAWTGTMCLTEPQCGTDLSLLRTKAEPCDDGYLLTGSKIFISSGDHDMAENIIHIVLARLPSAPEGTKGISLFIVPKFLTDDSGALGERNAVSCASLEHKMGIHGNATCALNFDAARGYLLGAEHSGLKSMFTFMNNARIGTALQGVAHAEFGRQKSLDYCRDRLAMRSLTGVKNPEGAADPIIVHPDVRRMLLTQKALTEGGRMLLYFTALQVDIAESGETTKECEEAESLLALLTPIAKAFLTEVGCECSNLALQCFGGHGYIRDWGVEQNVRDARISTLYEGTTGIQALDLLGRKVLLTQGELLRVFITLIYSFAEQQTDREMREFTAPLIKLCTQWEEITTQIGFRAMRNRDEVGAASVDYLMYSGYVALAFFWARAVAAAHLALKSGSAETDFYQGKIKAARFYFERILPRTKVHLAAIESGCENLMSLSEGGF